MASRILAETYAIEKSLVLLPVKFTANGSSAPTGVSGQGVASVTRTGTGSYLITLQDGWVSLANAQVSVKSTAGTPVVASGVVGTTDVVTAKTVVVYGVNSSGSIADFSAANLIEFHVLLALKNSGV